MLTLYGCIDKLPVKDAPCPCAEGWVCCAGTQSCALQDSECPVLCGNGLVEEGEDCDDGNTRDDGNGCSGTCSQNNICGDGVLQSLFESCDDGELNASYAPDATCGPTCEGLSGFCGDGIVNGPEPCDDGNAIDEDACLTGCVLNVCGDGLLNPNTEACDDSNSFTWDGCSENCENTAYNYITASHHLAASNGFTCALSDEGIASCWGQPPEGAPQSAVDETASSERYQQVVATHYDILALRVDGQIDAWRTGFAPHINPDERYRQLALSDFFWCGVTSDGELKCGLTEDALASFPTVSQPPQAIADLAVAIRTHALYATICIVSLENELWCVGVQPMPVAPDLPYVTEWQRLTDTPVKSVRANRSGLCVIHEAGPLTCWNHRSGYATSDFIDLDSAYTIDGDFLMVSPSPENAGSICALRADHSLTCWAPPSSEDHSPQLVELLPDLQFIAIAKGPDHTCGHTLDNQILCWDDPLLDTPATPLSIEDFYND